MADYQEIRDKIKEENRKRKEEERRNKPKLGFTEEQILTTIYGSDYCIRFSL